MGSDSPKPTGAARRSEVAAPLAFRLSPHPTVIGIIGGTGNEGSGLAFRWALSGHDVTIGSRSAEKATRTAEELNRLLAGRGRIRGATNREAARADSVVVLAVPHAAQIATAMEVRDGLSGKILIDVTVPLVPPRVDRVQLPGGESAVVALQRRLGDGVKVVSAFQNVSATHLKDATHAMDCDVLVCGDDAAACDIVVGLARDAGLRGWHAGALVNSIAAEAITSVLIALNKRYKVPASGIRITGLPEKDEGGRRKAEGGRMKENAIPCSPRAMRKLTLIALPGIPEVEPGTPLAELLLAAVARAGESIAAGDILVVAQKIVSKAEGRVVRLAAVTPSQEADELAQAAAKDPRLVELILRESRAVLRAKPGVIIVEHRLGFVMANAGIDQSNVAAPEDGVALLLPEDPDASARRIRDDLRQACRADVGVVINDSFGRAWRNGVTGVAIGVAGIPALVDLRGATDRGGRALRVTQVAAADEVAAAASLIMGQADEGLPAVLVRGFPYPRRDGTAAELVRPREEDLFR